MCNTSFLLFLSLVSIFLLWQLQALTILGAPGAGEAAKAAEDVLVDLPRPAGVREVSIDLIVRY